MSKYFDLTQAAAANAFRGNSVASVLKTIESQHVRSPRIRLPLFLYGHTEKGTPFFADAWTIHVSLHGASIVTEAKLQPDQNLVVINKSNEVTAACRVVWVAPGPEGNAEVTIEFPRPVPDFWSQASPHADAGTTSASLATAQNTHA
jgi:hypothetical protein